MNFEAKNTKPLAAQIHTLRGRFPYATTDFILKNFGVRLADIANEKQNQCSTMEKQCSKKSSHS